MVQNPYLLGGGVGTAKKNGTSILDPPATIDRLEHLSFLYYIKIWIHSISTFHIES